MHNGGEFEKNKWKGGRLQNFPLPPAQFLEEQLFHFQGDRHSATLRIQYFLLQHLMQSILFQINHIAFIARITNETESFVPKLTF